MPEKIPLNLLFVFGYQKYFINKAKLNKEGNEDKIHLLSSLLEDKKNYVFIINYVFSKEEYENHPNKDLVPPCVLENDSTHIPQDLIFRAKNLGHISIFHRKSLNIFSKINPDLDEVVIQILDKIDSTEYEINNTSRIMMFNLNDDKNDDSIFILSDYLATKDKLKHTKIEIY